jgi:iron(III) transport system substrate-binding protein
MRTNKTRGGRLVPVLAAAALITAACGGDDDAQESGGQSAVPQTTSLSVNSGEAESTSPGGSSTGTKVDYGIPSGDLDELIKAAQEEGELTFYSAATDEMNEAITKAFTEKYGIEVKTLRIATGGLIERFAGEQAAGVAAADVLNVATHEIFQDQPGWFVDFSPELLPELADYPESGWNANYATLAISPGVITYNTELVAEDEVPDSWEDMADPKWKGKILLTDPRSTPTYMGWAELMRRLYGVEYLEALAANDFDLVESATPGAQQVAAGAYYFNFPAAPAHSAALRAAGAPVGVAFIEEGSNGPAQEQGLVRNAPHPNAARLFMNFSLTVEAAELTCAAAEVAVPREGIEGCLELPESWEPVIFEVWQDQEAEAVLLSALGLQ